MQDSELQEFCSLSSDGNAILKNACLKFGLSARSYDRILKVARTIADIEDEETIAPHHLMEAIQYRCIDRHQHRMEM